RVERERHSTSVHLTHSGPDAPLVRNRGRKMTDQPSTPDNPVTLFLSYARTDEAHAKRLAAALQHAGYIVWWDAMIEGGAAFSKSIADALDSADAVLVLWSAHSI